MEHWVASFWMIVSAFFYSLQNVDAQYSGNMFGLWTVCFFRGIIGLCFSYVGCCIGGEHKKLFTTENWKLLWIRCLAGGATLITLFFSLLHCPVSTTTLITSTSSLWTAWIGSKVLPEQYQWKFHDVLIALWCFSGIVVLCIGNHNHSFSNYLGMTCALLSAIFQALVNVTIKCLDKEGTMVVAFWGMMGSVLLGTPGFLYETINVSLPDFHSENVVGMVSLLTTGILSVMAQSCKTFAIQHSKTMSVIVLRYMDVFFAILWDIFLLHQMKPWTTYVGISMVLSGCFLKCVLDFINNQKQLPLYSTSGSISMETTLREEDREC
jgi:drug/metabolite transporter (DMT)-like permease